MPLATFSSFRYRVYGGSGSDSAASGEQPNQALEVRLRHFSRQISGSPWAGVLVHEILEGNTTPTPVPTATIVFPLPLHEVEEDPAFFQIYVVQLLSSVNIRAAACEIIAEKIASYVMETGGGDRDQRKLQIVADVDQFELSWMEEKEAVEEGTAAMEEKVRNENGEELGDCSICLEELNYWEEKKREVIEIPCGHVYHESCIFKWLINSTSCPLCRCPLPLED